jgi:predicted metal-dependent enzyme (double-stranded beta helix superfamily)
MTVPARGPAPTRDLRALVHALAADPHAWRPLVAHGPERHFALLHRDAEVEVWVVSWGPGHDTGFHDHDDSAAAIVVAEGSIRELRLAVGRTDVDRASRRARASSCARRTSTACSTRATSRA